jgi:hypothetical protein
MHPVTIEEVKEILEMLYREGKVYKAMQNGEEVYFKDPQASVPAAIPTVPPRPPKPEKGDSYNLLQRIDPPIPYPLMNFRNQVYEITGVKNGERVRSKFFALDRQEEAANYLLSLDQGHVWLSEAADYTDSDYGVFTGKRKRVHLLSPDAIFKV